MTKHIVCYSGGHSSALVAIEVVRRFGAENTVILNHDTSSWVESSDVKRFKMQISNYLGIPITFAKWLQDNAPDKDCVIYYGFDENEKARIQRRSGILGAQGYKTDYPLALWKERTIHSTN